MAGLPAAFGARDDGDVTSMLTDPLRDRSTGIIAFAELCAASRELSSAVAAVLDRGELPLVVGGDCSLLLGAVAGVRHVMGRVGLWFVDGHADYLDGTLSPTGEAADMELAILTGDGPAGLVDLANPIPLVEPADVVILGHRPASAGPDTAVELGRVPAAINRLTADRILAEPGMVGHHWERELSGRGNAWLHIDLDALDETALKAVTYPQPNGLDWDSFIELIRPLLASETLVGMSVADFNPDLDGDGRSARRVVDAFAHALETR
jgi:arginase